MDGCSHIWRAVAGRPGRRFRPIPVEFGESDGLETVVGGETEKEVGDGIGVAKSALPHGGCPGFHPVSPAMIPGAANECLVGSTVKCFVQVGRRSNARELGARKG